MQLNEKNQKNNGINILWNHSQTQILPVHKENNTSQEIKLAIPNATMKKICI